MIDLFVHQGMDNSIVRGKDHHGLSKRRHLERLVQFFSLVF